MSHTDSNPLPADQPAEPALGGGPSFFADYFWAVVKNLIGYIFLGLAAVLGPLPGPGGIVLFLIGFGLISFPGKRRLISRMFRGRVFPIHFWWVHIAALLGGFAGSIVALWWLCWREHGWFHRVAFFRDQPRWGYLFASVALWIIIELMLRFFNWLISIMPKIRRAVRPWLRHRGIDLLPPRLRKRVHGRDGTFQWSRQDTEILRLHERHQHSLRLHWRRFKPWLKAIISVGLTVAIFMWMLGPMVARWPDVRIRIRTIDWRFFMIASAIFAVFLFVFRSLAWRMCLRGFGHDIPVAPSTRIWATSELSRYLPAVAWKVIGRIYLVRPYGVGAASCSASQIMELLTFLFANLLLSAGCMLWYSTPSGGGARGGLYLAVAIVPAVGVLLYPKVFDALLNWVMRWSGRTPPQHRAGPTTPALLALWGLLGLLFQSLAIWLIAHQSLHLPIEMAWIIAGAYSLAWCAGLLAFWAPGGLGVREAVLVMALLFALPPGIQAQFPDEQALRGFLAFLVVLLRLWTILGEIVLAMFGYLVDFRGALDRPDAPGRVKNVTNP